MSRSHSHALLVGQQVSAEVVELAGDGSAIVSFNGQLVRVYNRTHRPFRVGEVLPLKITAVSPLAFQLLERLRQGALDRMV